VFRESLIGNIQEFINTFEARNLLGDKELEALVGKAQEILIGVKTDDLRKKEDIRESTRKQFEEINAELGQMVELKKSRRFNLED